MPTTHLGGGETIALCPRCNTTIQMGSYRRLFCPTCRWTGDGRQPPPDKVFCCEACVQPLSVVLPLEGAYCLVCDYAPSLAPSTQDVFLKART